MTPKILLYYIDEYTYFENDDFFCIILKQIKK
jgi:hypothetical protein